MTTGAFGPGGPKRFLVLSTGSIPKARRSLSDSTSVQEDEVKDHSKLTEVIRLSQKRLSDLEANSGPGFMEFELNCSNNAPSYTLHELHHNFGGPVRYFVTYWTKLELGTTYPTTSPILIVDATSTDNILVLRSYVIGRAIVRVEPAGNAISFGES